MTLFSSSRGIGKSERGTQVLLPCNIFHLILLIFLCSYKLASPNWSLIPQVYTTDRCLPSIPSFIISEMLCFFIMDTYLNFQESSAHIAGFQVMLFCLVRRALLALLLSIQDCQLSFSSSFYFLPSPSDVYSVSFLFCSPLAFSPKIMHRELARSYSVPDLIWAAIESQIPEKASMLQIPSTLCLLLDR